jgi:adenylylsulfate kinase-like enzyme
LVIWITGLSGAGKTTLCQAIFRELKSTMPQLVTLDGDTIRVVLGGGLGYRVEDRVVQITRLQNLAKMLSDQGLVVLVAALYASPELLGWNRQNIDDYFEVYLEASSETLMKRDGKGLYSTPEKEGVPNVVGVDIEWHVPEAPDVKINTDEPEDPSSMARRIISLIPSLSNSRI